MKKNFSNNDSSKRVEVILDVYAPERESLRVFLCLSSDKDHSLFEWISQICKSLCQSWPTATDYRITSLNFPDDSVSLLGHNPIDVKQTVFGIVTVPKSTKRDYAGEIQDFGGAIAHEEDGRDGNEDYEPLTPKNLPPVPPTPRKPTPVRDEARRHVWRGRLFGDGAEGFPPQEDRPAGPNREQDDDDRELAPYNFPPTMPLRATMGPRTASVITTARKIAGPATVPSKKASPRVFDLDAIPSTPKKAKVASPEKQKRECEGCRIDAPSQKDHTCLLPPSSSSSSAPLSFAASPN